MEPCTLVPRYFLSFTKPPMSKYMLIKFAFFMQKALGKMENNKVAICKVPLCMVVH